LIACLPKDGKNNYGADLFIAALGARAQKLGFQLTNELRRSGIAAEMDYADKSLKSQMKRSDKLNSFFTLILGDKEVDEKQAQLRNMKTKDQQALPLDNLQETIIKLIRER
jgi:histidyl-tRNA synthetase